MLQNHMLVIIQRIPRYEMLFKEYLKKLPETSPDRPKSERKYCFCYSYIYIYIYVLIDGECVTIYICTQIITYFRGVGENFISCKPC